MSERQVFDDRLHVVCLIDILGQGEILMEWAKTPLPEIPLKAIQRTAGTTLKLKNCVKVYFESYDAASQRTFPVHLLDPGHLEAVARFKDLVLETQQFADTLVFYAPTANSYGDVSPMALYQILGSCSSVMLSFLSAGIPMRGGICIQRGMELEKHNFYGPALAEAYYLERKVAQWPRIVVSESVRNFTRTIVNTSGTDSLGGLNRMLATWCESMLFRHSDGILMLDFLGNWLRDIFKDPPPKAVEAIQNAYGFVRAEASKFRAKEQNEKNSELARRYALLQEHIELRLPIWGIKPVADDTEGKK